MTRKEGRSPPGTVPRRRSALAGRLLRGLLGGLLGRRLGGVQDGRPGRREPGDGHPEGRAADVVQPDEVAELDRGRLAAVLAADAQLDPGPRLPALLDGHTHELADAVAVEDLERVLGVDLLLDVRAEEAGGVVAADAERRLGQVVGAE